MSDTTLDKAIALKVQAVQQGQQWAGHLWDAGRSQFYQMLTNQKNRAATALGDVSQMLRQTGQQLRDQDRPGASGYADQAADRITEIAETVQQKEITELITDTEAFARRQPVLFLSIAAGLGLLLARFLKSASPSAA
jgi:hypothetical protein